MKLILLLFGIFFSLFVSAQDQWVVKHKSGILLKTSTESEEKNRIHLSKSKLTKYFLEVSYTQKIKQKGWKRTIMVYSLDDSLLLEKQTNTLRITDLQLKQWSKKLGTIKIYTWNLPEDPNLQATVRVRRVHLCTIHFK